MKRGHESSSNIHLFASSATDSHHKPAITHLLPYSPHLMRSILTYPVAICTAVTPGQVVWMTHMMWISDFRDFKRHGGKMKEGSRMTCHKPTGPWQSQASSNPVPRHLGSQHLYDIFQASVEGGGLVLKACFDIWVSRYL